MRNPIRQLSAQLSDLAQPPKLDLPRSVVTPFLVMEILEEAQRLERQGRDIVHFEVGEPDFDTPEPIKRAAIAALADNQTHYTHSLGLRSLREAISRHYGSRYDVAITPEEMMVTCGTSPALNLLFSALLRPGDEVILTSPYYACYPNFVRFAGGVPVFVELRPENGFQLDPAAVRAKITPRTKAILINSPANPTGVVLRGDVLRDLVGLGPLVISDEIYHGLTYEGEEHSALEYAGTDRVCVLNGFSKTYAMTGWRLGYIIASTVIIDELRTLHQNFQISASSFVQAAGIAALSETEAEVEMMRSTYARRRQKMLGLFDQIGIPVPVRPTGAFYVLADFRAYSTDSVSLAYEILRETGVATTPGIDFGPNVEGHLRFSYATAEDRIELGLRRIGDYLKCR